MSSNDNLPKNDPKSPTVRSMNKSRINRSTSDLSTGSNMSGSSNSRAPSTRTMNAPTPTRNRPKRSQSFKRQGVAQVGTSLKPKPRRMISGDGSTFGSTTSTSNFVKNFLEEDDDDIPMSASQKGNNGALADTQRNVHRSLLSPSTPSPGNSPESMSSRGSTQRKVGLAPPTTNLFQPRDDFYNVDQSVNLMDAEAGKYESKNTKNSTMANSMVEIFLKDPTAAVTGAKGATKSSYWERPSNWDRMSYWEKCKEVCARLVIPLFCCCILAVVILVLVVVAGNVGGSEDTDKPVVTKAPATTVPEVIVAPQETVLNTQGMTETMAAVSNALVDWNVVHPFDLEDQAAAPYQALEWISNDDIALAALPNAQRRRLEEDSQERLIQRYVLAVLYYSWNGMTAKADDLSAAALSNMNDLGASVDMSARGAVWLSAASECTWKGVECHAHTSQVQMAGSSSQQATQIRALNLTKHELQGPMPSVLTALTSLMELDLRHNQLSGNLNALQLGNWKRMEYLLLGSNRLTGSIPQDIGQLERAIDIDLGENQFTGSIPAISAPLEDLENMFLDDNQLTGSIPESFFSNLPSLMYLDVTDNELTGPIPDSLTELTDLRYFRAVNNSLTGNLPLGIGGLTKLDTLAVDNNKLGGDLPAGIFTGSKDLRYLQLNKNSFAGPLPESVANLAKLEILDLGNNVFTGTIPGAWFEGAKALMSVRLGDNKLTGTIPASIGNVGSTLEDFRVSENKLSGELPEEMGELEELRYCKMAMNEFTGSIPDSWAGMVQLEELKLFTNALTGSVPEDLCELEKENEGSELPVSIVVDCATGDITCDCCEKCV